MIINYELAAMDKSRWRICPNAFQLMFENTARCQHQSSQQIPLIWASDAVSDHIQRLFGPYTVEFINIPTYENHNKVSEGTEDQIIECILNQIEGADLNAADVPDFKNIINTVTSQQCKARVHFLTAVISELTRSYVFDDNSKQAYYQLFSLASRLLVKFPEAESILSVIKKIAHHERERLFGIGSCEGLHRNWTLLYEHLLENVLGNIQPIQEDSEHHGEQRVDKTYMVYGCGEKIFNFTMEVDSDIIDKKENPCLSDAAMVSGSSSRSNPLYTPHLLQIKTKPDLTACILEETDTITDKYPVLIVQLQTSFDNGEKSSSHLPEISKNKQSKVNSIDKEDDCDTGPNDDTSAAEGAATPLMKQGFSLSDGRIKLPAKRAKMSDELVFGPFEDSSIPSTSKRAKVSDETVPGPSKYCSRLLNFPPDDVVKTAKIQHFFELVAPMKMKSAGPGNFSRPCKTFGLYIIKNKVFITCLTVVSTISPGRFARKRIREFVSLDKKCEYVENNESTGTKFRYIFSDYLDIFNPVHFKVLLWYIIYLFEHEEKNIDYV